MQSRTQTPPDDNLAVPYIGSGPYCYTNCLATMMGANSADTAVIETATGSAFGMQLVDGTPFFDPYGWTPDIGLNEALANLGWTATTTAGGDSADALDRLTAQLNFGPALVGPVEMGYLRHQPGKVGPIGADHFVIVLRIDDDAATVHDPQGYPYARIPLADFTAAWRAETIDYGEPYTMRTDFVRLTTISDTETIRASIRFARDRFSAVSATDMPAGHFANADAALALAEAVEGGIDDELRDHLTAFAVRVGARRLADAAACLRRAEFPQAAATLTEQARLVGSLQHPLVVGDNARVAATLRAVAPTYDELRAGLEPGAWP
ncbi:hypothetical protein [Mycolicibacterium sp. YH-1]|uniref:hypothetical protein n=1 Tax=Mycolicibacterium sp. YH-1 TaxID=2908837 RepID=UPI001F4BE51F|nr:hypothetical protein [Mycolicibacterium sp. YH-1]UNB51704.1 hypothetical protein L0M16_27985 [Mycolicibacterium sp. YH-1]